MSFCASVVEAVEHLDVETLVAKAALQAIAWPRGTQLCGEFVAMGESSTLPSRTQSIGDSTPV
jgi:hypothetical protein